MGIVYKQLYINFNAIPNKNHKINKSSYITWKSRYVYYTYVYHLIHSGLWGLVPISPVIGREVSSPSHIPV